MLASTPDSSGPVWPWLIIVGGLMVIGVFGALAARRKIRDTEFEETNFSLQDLKDLRAQGKLTEVEYQAARQVLLKSMDRTLSDNTHTAAK